MRCHCRQIPSRNEIQTFGDFIDRDFWRLFSDSRNDESSTAHSFRKSVYDCSVDFPRSHIAFALALSCHSEMQNAATCNCGRYARSLEEFRFPRIAYVTTYIKALLPIRRNKERERILLPAERHANVQPIFLSRTIVAGWRTNR